jgi:hypothetical protein
MMGWIAKAIIWVAGLFLLYAILKSTWSDPNDTEVLRRHVLGTPEEQELMRKTNHCWDLYRSDLVDRDIAKSGHRPVPPFQKCQYRDEIVDKPPTGE